MQRLYLTKEEGFSENGMRLAHFIDNPVNPHAGTTNVLLMEYKNEEIRRDDFRLCIERAFSD